MKRVNFVTGLALISITILAACSSGPAANPAQPTSGSMGQPTSHSMMPTAPVAMMATTVPDMDAQPTPGMGMGSPTAEMMASTPGSMLEQSTPEMMGVPPTGGEMDSTPGAMMAEPALLTTSLVDVRSGNTFSIGDFKGKLVLVENMATWCPTCLSQEEQIQALLKDPAIQDHLVIVGLDIDPKEDAALLKAYTEQHSFDWNFAVAPAALAGEMGKMYGAQFLNPTSAPILLVDMQGNIHPLPFGLKDAASLQKALQPYLGM